MKGKYQVARYGGSAVGGSSWKRTLARKAVGYVVNRGAKRVKRWLGSSKADNVGHGNPADGAIDKYHAFSSRTPKRRRKSSRKTRIRKRKFKAKVLKAVRSTQLINTMHYRSSVPLDFNFNATTWATTPSQAIATNSTEWDMWGGNGTSDDLYALMDEIDNRQERFNTLDKPINKIAGMKIYVTYSTMEFGLSNLLGAAWDLQIYKCVAARDMSPTDGYSSPYTAWTQCITDLTAENVTAGFATMNVTNYGVEPTDCPAFGKHWRVVQKSTIFMDANTATTFKVTGPKGWFDMSKMNNLQAQKGKTVGFLFVMGGRIGNGITGSATMLRTTFSKTYHYKFPSGSEHLTGINIAQTRAV